MAKPPLVVRLDVGPVHSDVCPCGTSLLVADVLSITPSGVSKLGTAGVEVYTRRPHDCPQWSNR